MGYTHYWYRPKSIANETMQAICADFQRVVLALDDLGVKLADGHGEGVPVITPELICFNGLANCGHKQDESIAIPWPAPGAHGVNSTKDVRSGTWFAGALLSTRTCDGDCSYETVHFPATMAADSFFQESKEHPGLYFECCKTAYRPYDLAVTAFLIIAKRHLRDKISVSSDGEDENWVEGKQVCQAFLDYGLEFQMTEDGLI